MAGAVIGALRAELSASIAQFMADMNKAADSVAGFSKKAESIGKKMESVGKTLSIAVTAPITAFGALTLKAAGDFEAGMNRVQAVSGATATQLDDMRKMAIQLGQSTTFSASEVSGAMEMLAKNGLNAKQILEGATSASLNLAQATGSQLSDAADVVTSTMLVFNKKATDLKGVVNGITGATIQSKFGFEDYAQAIAQAGGVAGGLKVPFEDFNAALTATSSAFGSGSDAGTSFKTFLLRLTPQTKQAAEIMKTLGLNFYDSTGKIKSMAEIAGLLHDKLGGLTQEAQSKALNKIFGTDAIRTAIMLMNTGADGINRLKTIIGNTSAEQQAEVRMKGFNGQLEQLRGAIETLQIAIGQSGLLPFMTDLVSKLADIVSSLAQSNPEFLKWGTVAAAVAAAIGPLVLSLGMMAKGVGLIVPLVMQFGVIIAPVTAAIGSFVLALQAGYTVFQALGLAFAANPVGIALLALAAAALAVYEAWKHWDEIKAIFNSVKAVVVAGWQYMVDAIGNAVRAITDWLKNKLGAVFDWVGQKVRAVSGFFKKLYDDVVGHSFIPDMVDAIGDHMARLDNVMVKPAQDAANTVSDTMSKCADRVANDLDNMVQNWDFSTKSILKMVADMAKELFLNPATDFLKGVIKGGVSILSGGIGDLFGGFRAAGGGVSPGKAYVTGERGPELFVPKSRGEIIPNSQLAGAGGITFNVTTPDAQSFMKSETQIGMMLARAMARGKRNS